MQKQNSKIAFLYTNNQFTKEIIPQPKELLKKKKKRKLRQQFHLLSQQKGYTTYK